MIFTELEIKGVFLVDLDKRADDRGFFARVWCKKQFEMRDLNAQFVQCNLSFSKRKGTLRGLHYQIPPYQEVKLIQCVKGRIYDVIVDLRPESPTYRQWRGIELTADDYQLLYIPEGCAHGYQTQVDNTEVLYPVSQFYTPQNEQGIRWNDPIFAIEWPVDTPIISSKDRNWPDFCGDHSSGDQ